jgi:hypothetical protein
MSLAIHQVFPASGLNVVSIIDPRTESLSQRSWVSPEGELCQEVSINILRAGQNWKYSLRAFRQVVDVVDPKQAQSRISIGIILIPMALSIRRSEC